jgi:hypothetical protein
MIKPSIGQIVHFAEPAKGSEPAVHRAAIVTEINVDGSVELTVFAPNNMYDVSEVECSDYFALNTWHAPERVE